MSKEKEPSKQNYFSIRWTIGGSQDSVVVNVPIPPGASNFDMRSPDGIFIADGFINENGMPVVAWS